MALAKKLISKKDAVCTKYSANVNMTGPPPITSATVSAPVKPVVWKTKAQRIYSVTQTNPKIDAVKKTVWL